MRKYMDIINEALGEPDEDGMYASYDDDDSEDNSLVDKTATPPEYEDKDAQHYEARRKTGFFGAQAAGCIMMAKTTGRILIVLRSAEVEQPHTYGGVGGAFDASEETPVNAAKREAYEETGYTGDIQMIPLYVFKKDTFSYSNYLALVTDEFKPNLGWEADKAVWVEFGHWPKPLHFGLKALFSDSKSIGVIEHYSEMFKNSGKAVKEDITIPAGVNVANAITAGNQEGQDLAANVANGTETAPSADDANEIASDGQPDAVNKQSGTTTITAPTAPTAAPTGSTPPPAPAATPAPAPSAPPAKKSLAPITPQ